MFLIQCFVGFLEIITFIVIPSYIPSYTLPSWLRPVILAHWEVKKGGLLEARGLRLAWVT